jgi:hypothetical protein
MRVEGESPELTELLFPGRLIPDILRLLVDTWNTFKKPTDAESEPKITNRFVKALQEERRKQRLRFRIVPHPKDLADLDEKTGKGFAEIDIQIPHGYDERCYFGIEAKKLNTTSEKSSKWESHAGDYVGVEGMGCFVHCRYAAEQFHGGMLGYVMDGDCRGAKATITKTMTEKAAELMTAPGQIESSRHLPECADAFETRHTLDRGEFTIYHILLAA